MTDYALTTTINEQQTLTTEEGNPLAVKPVPISATPLPIYTIQSFGGSADTQTVSDASITGTHVHSATARFDAGPAGDKGKLVLFPGAGVAGAVLQAAVLSVQGPHDLTVSVAASVAIASGGLFAWGTDDGPALTRAATFLAANAGILLLEGAMMFGNGAAAWEGGTVWASGQTSLFCNLPATGDDDAASCIFFAATQIGATQILSANAAVGATSVQVAALPAGLTATSRGVPVVLSQVATFNANGASYIVESVSGGGPFTLHLDRALLLPYTVAGGAHVGVLSGQTNDFTLALGGAMVTGPAGRYFEAFIVRGWNLSGGNFVDTWGYANNRVVDLEAFCFDCQVSDCTFAGAQGAGIGSGEHCFYRRCVFSRLGAANALILGCVVDCWAVDVQASGSTAATGAVVFTDDAGGGQCFDSGVIRGSYAGNFEGVHVDFGTRLYFEGVTCTGNTSVGAHVGTTATGGPFVFDGCSFTSNAQPGAQTDAGSGFAVFNGCDFSRNTTGASGAYAVNLFANALLVGCTATPPAAGLNVAVVVSDQSGGASPISVTFEGCEFTGGIGFTGASPNGIVNDTTITLPIGGFFGILAAATGTSVVTMRNLVVEAAGGGSQGINSSATTTVRMYDRGPTIVGATTPTTFAGPQSRGATVQLNGTGAAVAVPWPDLQPGEMPKLEMVTLPTAGGFGAVGPVLVTLTPGTGFSVQGIAGDNSVRQYEI